MRQVAPSFEREHGCTVAEWTGWLPVAVHGHALRLDAGRAEVDLAPGMLQLSWHVLPPRRIALLQLPRLQVHYAFVDTDADSRARFMKRFDLHIQRGGG
jgi:hypothetical protein